MIKDAYAKAALDPDFEGTDDCSVVLRYRPDVPIWVVAGEERNMKVTEPIDVYIADKLFQLTAHVPFPTLTPQDYREALTGKTMVVFGGSYGIGADIAELAASFGANVATYSRSSTQTHVERRSDISAAAADALERFGSIDFVVNTAGVLPRGDLVDTSEETIYAATEINYVAPILIAQEFFPHLKKSGGSLLLFTSSSYTRGRSGYSLYSSAKAATVNLTQALADEWAGRRGAGQLRQPRAHRYADAHQGVRRGAAGVAAGVHRGGPGLASTRCSPPAPATSSTCAARTRSRPRCRPAPPTSRTDRSIRPGPGRSAGEGAVRREGQRGEALADAAVGGGVRVELVGQRQLGGVGRAVQLAAVEVGAGAGRRPPAAATIRASSSRMTLRVSLPAATFRGVARGPEPQPPLAEGGQVRSAGAGRVLVDRAQDRRDDQQRGGRVAVADGVEEAVRRPGRTRAAASGRC